MIVSFNPIYTGDRFIWLNHWIDPGIQELLKEARAVVLPQTIARTTYYFVRSQCPCVYPNYDARFMWEGKVGDAFLAWKLGIPHPPTTVFPKVVSLIGDHPEVGKPPFTLPEMPFVIKANSGGEGSGTWLIRSKGDLDVAIAALKKEELMGRSGFVVQEFLPGLDRTLRVVVIGRHIESYWRVGEGGGFYSNVARGARIEREIEGMEKGLGEALVRQIVEATGINLAGFDIYFQGGKPGLLEINYTFGLAGIGGLKRFEETFKREVEAWLKGVS